MKAGLIATWWRVCSSGFGLGADAAKAAGIVVFIVSLIAVIGIAILWWIIKFIVKRVKAKKEAEAVAAQKPEPKA